MLPSQLAHRAGKDSLSAEIPVSTRLLQKWACIDTGCSASEARTRTWAAIAACSPGCKLACQGAQALLEKPDLQLSCHGFRSQRLTYMPWSSWEILEMQDHLHCRIQGPCFTCYMRRSQHSGILRNAFSSS